MPDANHNDNSKPGQDSESYLKTVRQMAEQARSQSISDFGWSAFARLCMDFDFRICEAADLETDTQKFKFEENPVADAQNETRRLAEVLRLLATHISSRTESSGQRINNLREVQLAMCWLDAKGFGTVTLEALEEVLNRVRQACNHPYNGF